MPCILQKAISWFRSIPLALGNEEYSSHLETKSQERMVKYGKYSKRTNASSVKNTNWRLAEIYNSLKCPKNFHTTVIYVSMYLPNPSSHSGCEASPIFKQSLTGLNSEISFTSTGCLIKAKEPSLLNYLHIAEGRIIGFISRDYKCKVKSSQHRPGFELVSLCPVPTTITITPRAPPSH